ncbi:thiamine phosphate synthase [Actinobacillus succinogenes]|uniref:Thiamine-phosphate synthase n=1 Tax=Actinobacillus succinogenes (strain ATCC 55618 / DSM 22257 / CCUG 43843 / 130Z) TaxID=339671 RepID=THIE_ACTSZ|nr:thiamine phosphate synthase [Actinobacillus succinogenes]A6VPG9.1 RecName: Full=Thiamine-phosphate synthase; Short=TP synthase; Short=TPS; AltName: Full=Thiamine-phosphate pyrophosphorylase; Short=TMP pyrophosphorylase; Short=TMP-PPase [Actinobacillus succinogenes 130Z]ABR74866.1 thiamine-phosphate pyrophosphorylase [Actinobacillus succinogenes 130Z]PHI40724.1 thiamine phosphate synthase [Actinobacillus succinogenes]
MNKIKSMLSVYFIAGSQDCRHLPGSPVENLLNILQQALEAGITCFQFREKGERSLAQNPQLKHRLALQCQQLCRQFNVPFIINDDIGLALAIRADGIHVGQKDTAVERILSRADYRPIIGLSINTLEQAQANKERLGIDYFGIGPIFATQSKADHAPAVGMEFIRQIHELGIDKPCVAIGGIHEDNTAEIRRLGANGVAVISAITRSNDIARTVQNLACHS